MAETPGRNKSIDELTAEIAESRERVGRDLCGLRHELQFHPLAPLFEALEAFPVFHLF